MSELKAYSSERIYWAVEQVEREAGDVDDLHLDYNLFYLKSEADKVIAHQKYKRCLAMAYAEWLKQMSLWNYPESILYRRAARRERKWKELAEKFKQGLVIGVDKATGTDKTVVINYKEAK